MDDTALNLMGGSIEVGGEASYSVGGKTVSKSNLYTALQRCMMAKEYDLAYDSLPAEWRSEPAHRALDFGPERLCVFAGMGVAVGTGVDGHFDASRYEAILRQ